MDDKRQRYMIYLCLLSFYTLIIHLFQDERNDVRYMQEIFKKVRESDERF